MGVRSLRRLLLGGIALILAWPLPGWSEEPALPDPLGLGDVMAYARANRQEIAAQRAQAEAERQRVRQAGVLDNPMVSVTVDHLPFALHGVDVSMMITQGVPLSRERAHRREGQRWQWRRGVARAEQVELDVVEEAALDYLMAWELQQRVELLEEQLSLSAQLASAAAARYEAGLGAQAELLRAQLEHARLQAVEQTLLAQERAARAMLNMSLGRSALTPLGVLRHEPPTGLPPAPVDARRTALEKRPELRIAAAEVGQARAEVELMRSMYGPMAMFGVGPAHTMADGWGAMFMVGVSVPLWRRSLRAGVDEARAMVLMAEAHRQAMTTMVEGEVAVAREEVLAARAQWEALRGQVLMLARQSVEAALIEYGAGRVAFATVIESLQALFWLEVEEIHAAVALSAAWVRLGRALGTREGG